MSSWNHRQIRVFCRFGRLYRVALTPDVVQRLALRYARKHWRERFVGQGGWTTRVRPATGCLSQVLGASEGQELRA